ncbi:MAG: hypothetical protein EOO43_21895 [Flavobacterium sp.]|nr:MAG: hypothetical protein EOO43_21895 [Flavobacterium sp.]
MPLPAPIDNYAQQQTPYIFVENLLLNLSRKEDAKAIKYIIHKIEFHDTLDGLSIQYNVSAREIKIFNGLTTGRERESFCDIIYELRLRSTYT